MPVRLVTDSSCDLDTSETDELGIEVVPLSIRFRDDEYTDRFELSAEDFYAKMAATGTLPETAAPSPGAFEQALGRQVEAGADQIVCVMLSSKLSATIQAAETAVKGVADELDADIRVIDSLSISTGLGTMVRRLARAAADGQDADALTALADDIKARTHVVGTLDTLENLKKGGRIGGAQALLGSLLSIKPLVDISTGEVAEAGKARTRRRALEWLRDQILEQPSVEDLCLVHGGAPDVDTMVEMLAPHYSREDIYIGYIGAVIGTHGGPRVIGATWVDPS